MLRTGPKESTMRAVQRHEREAGKVRAPHRPHGIDDACWRKHEREAGKVLRTGPRESTMQGLAIMWTQKGYRGRPTML